MFLFEISHKNLYFIKERERQKLEAEEAKRREEEAEEARVRAEIERKENIARQKIELASEIPDEPSVNDPQAVRIVIKLPGGQRLERRFQKCQSLKVSYISIYVRLTLCTYI